VTSAIRAVIVMAVTMITVVGSWAKTVCVRLGAFLVATVTLDPPSGDSGGGGQCSDAEPSPLLATAAQSAQSASLATADEKHSHLVVFIQRTGRAPQCVTVEPSETVQELCNRLGLSAEEARLTLKGRGDVPHNARAVDVLAPGASLEILERARGGRGKRDRDGADQGEGAGTDKDGHTTITGLGRVHLGPAGQENMRFRTILLEVLEKYLVMARVLQHRMGAALYVWLQQQWVAGFAAFDGERFDKTFWIRQNARAFGTGLIAAAGGGGRQKASTYVPDEFLEAMKLVNKLYGEAAPAVRPGVGPDSESLRQFLQHIAPPGAFQPGAVLIPVGKAFGAAVRKQWKMRTAQQAWRNYLALTAEDVVGPQLATISAKVSLTLTVDFVFLTDGVQDRGAAIRRAVRQTAMQRLYADGFVRLGGFGVPAAFAQRDGEKYDDYILRCMRQYRVTCAIAMTDEGAARLDELVDSVREHGIGVAGACHRFLLVPAIAPLNSKSSGKPGGPLELTWAAMTAQPLLFLFSAATDTPFMTATTSMRPEAARVQQALRVVGRSLFGVAAMPDELPFAHMGGADWTAVFNSDVQCVACRTQRDVAAAAAAAREEDFAALTIDDLVRCPHCHLKLVKAKRFDAIGRRLLLAERAHQLAKLPAGHHAPPLAATWAGRDGAASVRLLQDRAQLLNGINDPTALDNLLLPEESVRRCLGEWGGWVGEIAKALHGVNLDHEATTFKVFKVFRVFRLTPGLEWKTDKQGGAKARTRAQKTAQDTKTLNLFCDHVDRASKDALDFVKRVLKTDGEDCVLFSVTTLIVRQRLTGPSWKRSSC
jgi:hypothetical protein